LRAANARMAVSTARCGLSMRRRGVKMTGLVTCEGTAPVVHGGGRVQVGRLALRCTPAPVELGAMPGGELTIGDRVFINQGSTIVAYRSISIGDDCRIGDYVGIYDTDHHPVEQGAEVRLAPVMVGRNVWIARGAIVLPGVSIGDHAVVGAGAVVASDVPPRALVAGNPARVVREGLAAEDGWRRP
jgi:acetyltransferase-like isoleucine patch superfamily enzyme